MIDMRLKLQGGITSINGFYAGLTQPVQLTTIVQPIPSGGSAVVATLSGPGVITRIAPVASGIAPFDLSVALDGQLSITGAGTVQALYQRDDGIDSVGGIECFIPFDISASVLITNNDASAADFQVTYAV